MSGLEELARGALDACASGYCRRCVEASLRDARSLQAYLESLGDPAAPEKAAAKLRSMLGECTREPGDTVQWKAQPG